MPERNRTSAWSDVLTKPRGQIGFLQLAAGKKENESDDLFLCSRDAKAIQAKEEVHRLEGDALVSIYEGMVLGETESVGCGERGKVGPRVVVESVLWPLQSRFQEPAVSEAEGATMRSDLIGMDREDLYDREPARLGHFANSRMAFRYCLAPSA